MRIGILANALAGARNGGQPSAISNGVALYIHELVSAMLEADAQNEFVFISETPVFLREPLLLNPRVSRAHTPVSLRGSARTGLWRERVMARGGVDILHEPEPCGGICRLSRYPLVVTVHDVIPMLFPEYFRRAHGWTFRKFFKRNVARADAVIADSESTRSDLGKVLPDVADRITVIHLAAQSLAGGSRLGGEAVRGPGRTKPYILSVSTIEPRKNHLALLDAYHRVRETGQDVQLVLVGEGGWRNSAVYRHPALKAYVNDIVFAGVVSPEELADLYRQAFAFVYPSLYEGFGMPPLEALAAGAPVIVGRNSSFPEVLGDAAYYVSARPTGEEIADAIGEIARDPDLRSRLSSAGRQRAGLFSWANTAAETLAVYEDVLRRRERCSDSR